MLKTINMVYLLKKQRKRTKLCFSVAYDISKRMKDCMDNQTGEIGYCWMHHFMCSGKKWCNTWVAGGPITSDSESYEKQMV